MKLTEKNKAFILECLRNAVQYGDQMFAGESIKSEFQGYVMALMDDGKVNLEQQFFLRTALDCALYKHDHCENPEQERGRYSEEHFEFMLDILNQLNKD